MRIAVIPASPRTGKATIEALLQDPSAPQVVAVYRDTSKAPTEFKSSPRFEVVQGDVGDASSLNLEGVDVVVAISPPIYGGNPDPITAARANALSVSEAIKKSSTVKKVVYLSSWGAEHEHGTGEIGANHAAETVLKDVASEVVFVRCAYFMHNWNLPTLKEEKPFVYSTVTPVDFKVPMVAVKDIGHACAAQAVDTKPLPQSPYAFRLFGPEDYSTNDVQQALGEVLGKEVRVETVPVEGFLGFFSHVFPPNVAQLFTDMTKSFLPGGVLDATRQNGDETKRGKVDLVEGFKEMLSAYGSFI